MFKKIFVLICCVFPLSGYAVSDMPIESAEELFKATKIVCSGISDEISKVSKISKVNTAVTAAGTVAAGGALAVGIAKSREEKEIDALVKQICDKGGCSSESVEKMSDEEFFNTVIVPMSEIARLQKSLDRSKKLGNWRTGLMAGTIGTNLASAIISGVNRNQSELIQHIQACNEMVESVNYASLQLKAAGISPMENQIVKDLDNVKTWCNQIDIKDIEKIEKRMTGVMGTSIAGGVIGVVGTVTSAEANSNKYMDKQNRLSLTESDKNKKDALNTTANVMAGANIVTGAVETGLNISLITLTKRLMQQAELCEEILK